jgi:hypothetical protein
MFLLAARDDELVAVEQLFATQRLVNTPPGHIRKAIVPCRHLGLFVGKTTLRETWPMIARWIRRPTSGRPESDSAYGEAVEVRPKGRPANVITSVSDV